MNIKKLWLVFVCLGFLASISSLGWSYRAYCIIKKEIIKKEHHPEEASIQRMYQKTLINLSLSILFSLMFLLLSFGLIYISTIEYWWIISGIVSLLGLLELIFIWNLLYERGFYYSQEFFKPIPSKTEQQSFLQTIQNQNPEKTFISIPTGIYVEHLYFARKDNDVYPGILINGIIWQRYAKNIPTEIQRNIILPDANQGTLQEIFRTSNEKEELIGWHFSGSALFQHFDLDKFPLDYRHVEIKLLHPNFEKNVICVPDFESYTTSLNNIIGLKNSLSIPHWHIHKSFFGFTVQNFGTTFGHTNFVYNNFPQLIFFIMTHRILWDTAGIYLILLLIVAIILFVTLLAFLRYEPLTNLLGFSTISVVGVCSSLLFVLISSHMEMRTDISIAGTAYIEWLYAILYIATIFITISAILFALSNHLSWISYKENCIITKLLYWPLIIYCTVLITVVKFY